MIHETGEQLQTLTNSVTGCARGIRLDMSVEKTKSYENRTSGSYVARSTDNWFECVDEFCYLQSIITDTGSCDKEVKTRIGRANSTFKRLDGIRRHKHLGLSIKIRLYQSLVLAILLYCAER